MSQRHFRSGPYTIKTGYDRVSRRYVLLVTNTAILATSDAATAALRDAPPSHDFDRTTLERAAAADPVVYSHLTDWGLPLGELTLAHIAAVLGSLQCPLPPTLLADLREDATDRRLLFLHYGGDIIATGTTTDVASAA